MKTERVFLMDLFLDDELPKNIKLKIKDRFQEMDEPHYVVPRGHTNSTIATDSNITFFGPQAPSMQRLMQQNPDLIPKPPTPTTPAAAQALAARTALLQNAGNEKPENGRKSPRKV